MSGSAPTRDGEPPEDERLPPGQLRTKLRVITACAIDDEWEPDAAVVKAGDARLRAEPADGDETRGALAADARVTK